MQTQTKNYLLRGIPNKLYRNMKVAATRQDKTLKEWIVDAFKWYLKNGGKQ